MTALTSLPLSRLVRSRANVRRTERKADLDGLTASLAAHGLRQNLSVRPITGGRFEVVAGGRRLEALKRLHAGNPVDGDSDVSVPCMVLAEADDPTEISLAENLIRRPAHADDEAAAFRQLADRDGLSIDDLAARFGTTPAFVWQRLQLAAVAPSLRALFRRGELDLAQMKAFALVADPAEQERVHAELPDWNRSPEAIRRALTRTALPLSHRLARFVGSEIYEAAGGMILRDLFGDPDQGFMTDAALVDRLATGRLEDAATAIRAEGWSFVLIEATPDHTTDYGRVYPTVHEPEPVFAPEDLARAGARLTVSYDGDLQVERGLVRREPRPAHRRSPSAGPVDGLRLPDKVIEDLTAQRTAALRVELARRPDLALAATVHALCFALLYPRSYEVKAALDIQASSKDLEPFIGHQAESSALEPWAETAAAWQAALPANPAELWAWCLGQDQATLLDLLAFVAASSLDATRTRLDPSASPRLHHADRLADALALDMTRWWRPSFEGFANRLPKTVLADALREIGDTQLADQLPGLKKAEAARRAATALAATSWLPQPLRAPAPAAAAASDPAFINPDTAVFADP